MTARYVFAVAAYWTAILAAALTPTWAASYSPSAIRPPHPGCASSPARSACSSPTPGCPAPANERASSPVADIDTRRMYLHDTARNLGVQLTTGKALEIYAESPWPTVGKGAARRDLRDLARRSYLIPVNGRGPRTYDLSNPPPRAHPHHGRSLRQELLKTICREGGEWTAGRAKAACRRLQGTHVWRATARRLLAELHRRGELDRHGDGTPRRFYTVRKDNA